MLLSKSYFLTKICVISLVSFGVQICLELLDFEECSKTKRLIAKFG